MAIFYNQAQLTYQNNTINSNIVSAELVEVLSAGKTAVVDTYQSGDTITYIVNLANSGTTAFTGLTVTDNLGAYPVGTMTVTPLDYVDGSLRFYQNGVLQPAPTVAAEDPLTITGVNVPSGGSALLVYEARVNDYAPTDTESSITNTATISGGGLTAPITVSETVNAAVQAALSITKTVCPEVVTENAPLTYTFVIENSGNTATADPVVVTDVFDPVLENITVTYNGNTLSTPADYTYDPTTGVFSTVAGVITVPAAVYTQDPATGLFTITPGVSVLRVTGTV